MIIQSSIYGASWGKWLPVRKFWMSCTRQSMVRTPENNDQAYVNAFAMLDLLKPQLALIESNSIRSNTISESWCFIRHKKLWRNQWVNNTGMIQHTLWECKVVVLLIMFSLLAMLILLYPLSSSFLSLSSSCPCDQHPQVEEERHGGDKIYLTRFMSFMLSTTRDAGKRARNGRLEPVWPGTLADMSLCEI